MKSNISKKPALTVEVTRSTMEKLEDQFEVATRLCDGEEGYLDVSVFDTDVVESIAKTVGCGPLDIQGNLLVLSVID